MSKHDTRTQSRYLTITQARKELNQLVEDPSRETLILRDGVPAAMLVGIDAWAALQDMLGLMRNPAALARSLAKHQAFQASEPVDAVTLEDLAAEIEEDRQQLGRAEA